MAESKAVKVALLDVGCDLVVKGEFAGGAEGVFSSATSFVQHSAVACQLWQIVFTVAAVSLWCFWLTRADLTL